MLNKIIMQVKISNKFQEDLMLLLMQWILLWTHIQEIEFKNQYFNFRTHVTQDAQIYFNMQDVDKITTIQ